MVDVVLPSDFDISLVTFGVPKSPQSAQTQSAQSAMKFVPILYDGRPLFMQTPKLHCPYGVNRWDNNGVGAVKVSIDVSMGRADEGKDKTAFFEAIKALNKRVVDEAFQNSVLWLKKTFKSLDVIEALNTPMIKYDKDKVTGEVSTAYPPKFKIQLPQRDGKWAFETYDAKKERIDFDSVEIKGGEVVSLILCTGVWVAGGKFGCSWKAMQLKVYPHLGHLKPFAFVEETDE